MELDLKIAHANENITRPAAMIFQNLMDRVVRTIVPVE
jgi:hypothetical protein